MIGPVTATLSECRRGVSVLVLLLSAFALRAQETGAPAIEGSPVRIPDIVITGADAIIIVPPLPVLVGGGIPVPPVELTPIRFRPSPADCVPPSGSPPSGSPPSDSTAAGQPDLCEPPALVRLLPFFLSGAPPLPAMNDLGVRYPAPGAGARRDPAGVDGGRNDGVRNDEHDGTARNEGRDE